MVAEKEPPAGSQKILVEGEWIPYDPDIDEDTYSSGSGPNVRVLPLKGSGITRTVNRLTLSLRDGYERLKLQENPR